MSVQYKNRQRAVAIAMTCALGTAAIIGSAGQATAADTPSNVLDVSSLQQLPDRSLADTRGGAIPIATYFNFLLQSLFHVSPLTVTQFNFHPGTNVDQQTHTVTFTSTQ